MCSSIYILCKHFPFEYIVKKIEVDTFADL